MPMRMMAHCAIARAVVHCAQVAARRHAAGTAALHRPDFRAAQNRGMLRLLVLASCLLFVLFLYAQFTTARAATPSYIPTLEQFVA